MRMQPPAISPARSTSTGIVQPARITSADPAASITACPMAKLTATRNVRARVSATGDPTESAAIAIR